MGRSSRRAGQLPVLPLVSLVSAGFLAGCTPDHDDSTTRVCRNGLGQRAPDVHCERSAGSGGGGFVYLPGNRAVPAVGQAVGGYRLQPGQGTVRAADGRIVRGGLGASARASASS